MKRIFLLLICAHYVLGKCPPKPQPEFWTLILTNKNLSIETREQLGFVVHDEFVRDLPRHQGTIYKDKIDFADYGTLKNFVLWMKQENPNKKIEFTYDKFRIKKKFYVTLIQENIYDDHYVYGEGNFTKRYYKGIGYK
jgi:hypothetical protein